MLNNINMELIEAFNPLYAVPIVAVIFCALLVYTLGFKSPIQPPSFEGFDEDKKFSKKRKAREIQKQTKLVTNGKANGIVITKGKVQEVPKKKEVVYNSEVNEKPRNNEKTLTDKKAAKKMKPQNEKQQEKKKQNAETDELNDDGWVQQVSKKGKKKSKKEDNTISEVQSNTDQSPIKKIIETIEVDDADKVFSSHVKVLNEEKKTNEEKPLKKSSKKETTSTLSPDKPVKLEIAVEVKPDENYLELDLKQSSTNIPTVSEDSNKSKKKKRKQVSAPVVVVENSKILPPLQVEPVINIIDQPLAPPSKNSEALIDNVPVNIVDDSKTNVVFDELAGLYPEAKEKKKKKVRRDH